MAIEAKATLLNEMERALATELTAAERDRILAILTEKLDGYDLTIISQDGIQQDDLLDAYLSSLAIEGRSPKTVERYRYLLTRMMAAVKTPTRKITVTTCANTCQMKRPAGSPTGRWKAPGRCFPHISTGCSGSG